MAQGNPNKVNAIVDEIVKNNKLFKLKSPVEQDKEKDSIVKSINSAISVLNEVGKELVLEELAVDPDEKFKGLIDSVGNVDIPGITKMTATIVKSKIEEAEREGLNLKNGETVFKENKISMSEKLLTVTVLNTMVSNYENLSFEEKELLLKNYKSMSDSDKKAFTDNVFNELEKQELSDKEKEELAENRKISDIAYEVIGIFKESKGKKLPLESLIEKLQKITEYDRETIQQILIDNNLYDMEKAYECAETKTKENFEKRKMILLYEKYKEDRDKVNPEDRKELEEYINKHPEFIQEREKAQKQKEDINQDSKGIQSYSTEEKLQDRGEQIGVTGKDVDLNNIGKEISSNHAVENIYEEIKEILLPKQEKETEQFKLDNLIRTEIKQLPSALSRANFSQEEIKEALTQYKTYFENASNDDIDFLAEQTVEDRNSILKEEFENLKLDEKTTEILRMMSNLTFGGNMQKILTNLEVREQFLAQFNKVIEQGINLDQDVNLDEELTQIFGQYFQDNSVEMDVSAIEEQKEQTIYEEHNEEMAKVGEEYSAATQNIQGSEQFEESKEEEAETKDAETIAQEIAKQEENLPAKQDNSFIGKIKRVFANMRDMKNKDNSKGFFARLGASIQTVFGSKKEEYYDEQDTDITSSSSQSKEQTQKENQQTNYLTQHFDINEKQAIQDLKKKQGTKDPQLSQEDQELENV